ncbi:aldo/keto reductase [Deefgea sp. CFH1-16]|uniref:aldo/keto reductase n=1 Tax=Deefgea sp. CFH1-16 TaxID=2675457 RepID=UPI002494C122|nr:aldo/keto reductase [Deefgea sp. CFH1-16]
MTFLLILGLLRSDNHFLNGDAVMPRLAQLRQLNALALQRGQTLAQMALAWALLTVTSVIIGASRVSQLEENVGAITNLAFSAAELQEIERILAST